MTDIGDGTVSDLLKDMGKDELINMMVRLAHELELTADDLDVVKQLFVQDLRQRLGDANG